MTRAEYTNYVWRLRASERWLSRFDPIDPDADRVFSWRACDVCERSAPGGGPLAGTRTVCLWVSSESGVIVTRDGEPDELLVCDDCVYFQEYGRLDDATMLALETEVE